MTSKYTVYSTNAKILVLSLQKTPFPLSSSKFTKESLGKVVKII